MKLKIRKAKSSDFKKIKEIYFYAGIDEIKTQYPKKPKKKIIENVKEYSKEIFKEFDKKINSKKNYWIIAEIEKELVGFANVQTFKKYGWLDRNYIKKEFRGKGIGKRLTEERMKWLRKNKIKEIYAKVFIENKPSLNNLKNFGFEPIEYIMEKKLK